MLLVLILVATAVILGMSYLSSAAMHTAVSQNMTTLSQARYLAESGLEHGKYLLKNDPNLSGTFGPYKLQGCNDLYYITAGKVSGQTTTWLLESTAYVHQTSRKSSATVARVVCPPVHLKHGMVVGNGSVTVPWGLDVKGDIYVKGRLTNWSSVHGSASATGGVVDTWNRIEGAIDGNATPITPPVVTIAQYSTYKLNGLSYSAEQCTKTSVQYNDALANGHAVKSGNVGGVIYMKPSSGDTVTLQGNLDFTGTIIIDGNVRIDGGNITLTAVEGFPAIVATGSVKVTANAINVNINGLVVAKQGIVSDGSAWNSTLNIKGGLVTDTVGVASGLAGTYSVKYKQELAEIYDFSLDASLRVPQVSVLTWND